MTISLRQMNSIGITTQIYGSVRQRCPNTACIVRPRMTYTCLVMSQAKQCLKSAVAAVIHSNTTVNALAKAGFAIEQIIE